MAHYRQQAPLAGFAGNSLAKREAAFSGVVSWELPFLLVTLVVAIALYIAGGYAAVHYLVPCGVFFAAGAANWQMVRAHPASLWTPLFAFRMVALIFIGFGGFLSVNLSIEAAAIYFAELTFTDAEAANVFLLWLTGHSCAIAGYVAARHLARPTTVEPLSAAQPTPALPLGALFFLAGLGFYVVVELPAVLGFPLFGIVPNAIAQPFQAALAVGVFLITLWALDKSGPALFVIPLVVGLAALTGLVAMTKAGVILPVVFASLAYLYKRVSVLRIVMVVSLLGAMFAVLQPMVAHAREEADLDGSTVPTLGERFALYGDYFTAVETQQESSNRQADFLRFGHTHVAAFVVDRYNSGMPSDALQGAFAAMVPRVIWPDKPVVTQDAQELYYLVSGQTGSALAASVYADIYWNIGWSGVVILPFLWGGLMFIGTQNAYQIVRRSDWFMMPYVLLVFRIGLSFESSFIVGTLLPTIMAAVGFYALRAVRGLLVRRNSVAGAPRAFAV